MFGAFVFTLILGTMTLGILETLPDLRCQSGTTSQVCSAFNVHSKGTNPYDFDNSFSIVGETPRTGRSESDPAGGQLSQLLPMCQLMRSSVGRS